jgi:hypothetical protein
MISFIIFILISLGFWIYSTKINKNFGQNIQKKIIDYVNDIVKNINPVTDNLFNNNIPLMKTNLYLMTFYKNIDLYNIIYNSNDLSFLINKQNSRNIQFDDIKYLIPSGLAITEDTLKTKLSLSYVSNDKFSKFFLDLSIKGVYLLDYWNIFFELIKPLIIIKSDKFTDNDKITKLNNFFNTDDYDLNKIVEINNNSEKIIEVIYQSILILSNITIKYKDFISDSNINLEQYFTQLDTYLNKNIYEYIFIKNYIYNIVNINTFINQSNTNYIILYKMFNNIDNFAIYNQLIDSNIIPSAINLNY